MQPSSTYPTYLPGCSNSEFRRGKQKRQTWAGICKRQLWHVRLSNSNEHWVVPCYNHRVGRPTLSSFSSRSLLVNTLWSRTPVEPLDTLSTVCSPQSAVHSPQSAVHSPQSTAPSRAFQNYYPQSTVPSRAFQTYYPQPTVGRIPPVYKGQHLSSAPQFSVSCVSNILCRP